jgi:hypothetical protein
VLEFVLARLLHPGFDLEAFLDQGGWDLGVGRERSGRLGLSMGEIDEERGPTEAPPIARAQRPALDFA